MKRTTIAAIGLAAALVAVPTVVASARSPQSDQTAATCPYLGDSEIDHQTMHNQMAGIVGTTSSTGMMGIGPGAIGDMNGMNGMNGMMGIGPGAIGNLNGMNGMNGTSGRPAR